MPATLRAVEPVLAVRDVDASVRFYERLGFKLRWRDARYAVLVRDAVCLHLQWHDAKEWEGGIDRPMLRFVVPEVASLAEEYRPLGVFHRGTALRKTDWGTEEFAFYDLDKNGLTFYRDLGPAR
jgi:catechol 2,3-dioxygenase-like lactoylglutathione lyase family enzyme